MSTFITKILITVSLIALSSAVNASLITNGSFEKLILADNSKTVDFVRTADLLEFDYSSSSPSKSMMTLTIGTLIVSTDYLLEFYYKPRDKRINENSINVYWYAGEVDFALDMQPDYITDSNRKLTPSWSLQSELFNTGVTMDLSLASFGEQSKAK